MNKGYTFDDVQILPNYSEVTSRSTVSTRSRFTRNWEIDIPLVAAPMDTVCGLEMVKVLGTIGAVGCLHRFMSIKEQVHLLNLWSRHNILRNTPLVATIGATGDYQERAEQSLDAGANVILIDVAHGDHLHVRLALDWLNRLSNRSKFDVIAGNIATGESAVRLAYWGADALRVGIGGGAMCETRVRTGIGVPQLSAIDDVVLAVQDIPIISDGGIRYPGDVAKAIAAGADTVMLGSLLAGTDEAPGDMFVAGQWPNTKVMKMFRGSASATAKMSVNGNAEHVEGASRLVESKGPVERVIRDIVQGLQSSMSYVGADSIAKFKRHVKFIEITGAGLAEAHPHGLR
jgi:IMP dehydrogenase